MRGTRAEEGSIDIGNVVEIGSFFGDTERLRADVKVTAFGVQCESDTQAYEVVG